MAHEDLRSECRYFIMGYYLEALMYIITAVFLLWFGYTLFFGLPAHAGSYNNAGKRHLTNQDGESYPGAPRTCPVCCARLNEGELVKTHAFPSLNGGQDRLMHIKGCVFCLYGERDRICPVCKNILREDEILVCRMFERRYSFRKRPHVHVLGCSRCRGV